MTEIYTGISTYVRIHSQPGNAVGLRWSFFSDEDRTQELDLSSKTFRWYLLDENYSPIDDDHPKTLTASAHQVEVKYEEDDPLLEQTDYLFRLEVEEFEDTDDYFHGLWSFTYRTSGTFTSQTDFEITLPGGDVIYARLEPFFFEEEDPVDENTGQLGYSDETLMYNEEILSYGT